TQGDRNQELGGAARTVFAARGVDRDGNGRDHINQRHQGQQEEGRGRGLVPYQEQDQTCGEYHHRKRILGDGGAAAARSFQKLEEEESEGHGEQDGAQAELPYAAGGQRDGEAGNVEIGARPGKGDIGEERNDEERHR